MYGNVVHCSIKNITSQFKGQKTAGFAPASLIVTSYFVACDWGVETVGLVVFDSLLSNFRRLKSVSIA